MSRKKPFEPFDPLLGVGRAVPYHPHWNLLTGSLLASILLQQIIYWWQERDRRPFYKYAAPCPSARVGDSWQEELDISRRQFDRARSAIAVRTQRHLKDEKLKTNMVVYWTEPNHRTYYAINESLLLTRLANALASTGKAPPDAHNPLWPIAAHIEHHTAAARNEQRVVGRNVQPPVHETANSCTERTRHEQQRDGGDGGAGTDAGEADLDEELVKKLTRLGDNNARDLVARYPAPEIRHWLVYALSPRGDNLHNKPGFIRARLKQSALHGPPPQSRRRGGPQEKVDPAGSEPLTSRTHSSSATTNAHNVWSACLEELSENLSPMEFAASLEGTRGLELTEGVLRVSVGNRYTRGMLNHTLRSTIERTLAQIAGDLEIEFLVIPDP